MELSGKTALVTGATGFIGGRLVEKLTLEYGVKVRALARDFHSTSWLSRTKAEVVNLGLEDVDKLSQALSGCNVVFHCAASTGPDYETAYRTNVLGTRNLLEAARSARVGLFVHISTVAIHQPAREQQLVTEETPFIKDSRDAYVRTKLEGELLALEYQHKYGLPVVVLRPTIVYGPRAYFWTMAYAERIQRNAICLTTGIDGAHNFVYVDDVIQAILLAAVSPAAVGESFIIGAVDGMRWLDYINHYALMAGINLPVRWLPLTEVLAIYFDRLDTWIAALSRRPSAWKFPILFGLRAARRLFKPWRGLELWELKLFRQTQKFSINKAQMLLGYQPKFDLSSAMDQTQAWLFAQCYLADPQDTFHWPG